MTSEKEIIMKLCEGNRKKFVFESEDIPNEEDDTLLDSEEINVEEENPEIEISEDSTSSLSCECGSTNIIKENGKCVCDDCGRKVTNPVNEADDESQKLRIIRKALGRWKSGNYQKAVELYKRYGISDAEFARYLVGSLREDEDPIEESINIKVGNTFKNAGFTWKILDIKGEYTLLYAKDKKFNPYVVAWKLDTRDGSWGQGRYFDNENKALRYMKTIKENSELEIISPEKESKLDKNIIRAIQKPITTADRPSIDSSTQEGEL